MTNDDQVLGANEWRLTDQRAAEHQEIIASWKRSHETFEAWASDSLMQYALILHDQIVSPGIKNTSQVSSIREVRDVIDLTLQAIQKMRENRALAEPRKPKKRTME